MQKLTYWEQKEIERLSKKEADEPEFVTKRKQEMIKLIKEGKGDEIVYDEWGEVYSPLDPDTADERLPFCRWKQSPPPAGSAVARSSAGCGGLLISLSRAPRKPRRVRTLWKPPYAPETEYHWTDWRQADCPHRARGGDP